MFLAQGNNRGLWWVSNSRLTGIHRSRFRHATHCATPPQSLHTVTWEFLCPVYFQIALWCFYYILYVSLVVCYWKYSLCIVIYHFKLITAATALLKVKYGWKKEKKPPKTDNCRPWTDNLTNGPSTKIKYNRTWRSSIFLNRIVRMMRSQFSY